MARPVGAVWQVIPLRQWNPGHLAGSATLTALLELVRTISGAPYHLLF